VTIYQDISSENISKAGLYYTQMVGIRWLTILSVLTWILSSCTSPEATQSLITVEINVDNTNNIVHLVNGSTVQHALDINGISLNSLDRTEPPLYTLLSEGDVIHVIRVSEKFDIQKIILPYEHQTLRNESLAKDKEILIQKGQNGYQEITYRLVYENGIEISTQPIPVKVITIEEPVPEIIMIGVQSPFSPVPIPGKMIYLRDGNVWMIEGTTGNRQAIITTGDLDGRVFSLSSDCSWLLFSRRSTEDGQINSLWAANVGLESGISSLALSDGKEFVNLNVSNVIHFADWIPGSNTKIIFSTVEPRSTAPGWQANNDLNVLTFSTTGWTTKWTVILESNSGGVYGWWGTNFSWSPDNINLTYVRPGSIGLVNYKDGLSKSILDLVPFLTHRDWAWIPGLTWGPDGRFLYTVDHVAQSGSTLPEESQQFDLVAISIDNYQVMHIVSPSGMFSYPLASPWQVRSSENTDYQIAYLHPIFPDQSETSRYNLVVMDRDGSNKKVLFPEGGVIGMEPQQEWGAWSPAPMPGSSNFAIAIIYQGNLWLVDVVTGQSTQITSDGLTSRVVWK
jgi:hypothetical protein